MTIIGVGVGQVRSLHQYRSWIIIIVAIGVVTPAPLLLSMLLFSPDATGEMVIFIVTLLLELLLSLSRCGIRVGDLFQLLSARVVFLTKSVGDDE